ncbi:MAG: hypothetical protein QM820_19270 [Minicystis sp.]
MPSGTTEEIHDRDHAVESGELQGIGVDQVAAAIDAHTAEGALAAVDLGPDREAEGVVAGEARGRRQLVTELGLGDVAVRVDPAEQQGRARLRPEDGEAIAPGQRRDRARREQECG